MLHLKLTLGLLYLTCSVLIKAQNGYIKVFDNSPYETAVFLDMINDQDTLVFYGVTVDSFNTPGIGFYQIDTLGNLLKRKLIIDPDTVWTTSGWSQKQIIRTKDGNYAIIGGSIDGSHNTFFMKVDGDFNLVLKKQYPADRFIGNASLIEDGSGFLIVCHIEQANNSLANDILVIKIDQFANEIWRKMFGANEYSESPSGILKIGVDEYLIYGRRSDYPEWDDPSWPQSTWGTAYLLAIDSSGNKIYEWASDTSTHRINSIHNIASMSDGYLFTGLSWELFQGGQHSETYAGLPMLVRLDKDLNIVWEKAYGFLGHYHLFQDLEQTMDGNFLASGFLAYTEQRPQGVHFKFTPNGDSLWMRLDTIYPLSHTRVQATEILSSGSIISIGYAHVGPYGQTGFIMKLSPDGCIDTLNCFPYSVIENTVYDRQELSIFPNPASNHVIINIPVSMSSVKYINIRNIQGSIIRNFNSIDNTVSLNISSFPAGKYFVEVQGDKEGAYGQFQKL